MTNSQNARLCRLERASGTVTGNAPLVLIHSLGRTDDELVAVSGLEALPRLPDETGAEFVDRLRAHVAATRKGAAPMICFAGYAGDERT